MLATWDHAREDSATIDEAFHIFAGAEYWSEGTFFTNPEHPPLAKLLAAAALMSAGPRPPKIAGAVPMPPVPDLLEFFRGNRIPYRTMMALARRPFRWLLAALVVVVYLAARAAWGTPAAMLASALVALDPNFIAHAGIVHTDVPAALFMTLTVVLTIAALGRSPVRWLFVGITLGLALTSKFTALILVPLVLLSPLLLLLEGTAPRRLPPQFGGATAACIVAGVTVLLIYGVATRSMTPDNAAAATIRFLRSREVPIDTARSMAALSSRAPQVGLFLTGIEGVRHLSGTERPWNFLHGKLSRRGFPHYFLVAFLIKSTPAMLLVTAAIFAGGRRLLTRWGIGLLAPVVVLFAVSIPSSFNIGVRHILPVYPLLAIAGSIVLASRLPPRWFAGLGAALILSAAVSLILIHPFELGYFNFLVGGPEEGGRWLSDSNIDWGQDIDRLNRFLAERGWARDTTVVVFATVVHWPDLAQHPQFDPATIRPGRYALSSYMENVGPAFTREYEGEAAAAQLSRFIQALHTRGRRVARVGASITIWELSTAP